MNLSEKYHKIVVGADNSIEMTLPVYGVNKNTFEEGKYYVDGYVKVIRFLNKQAFIDFTKEAQNKYQARISSYYSEIANNFYNDLEASTLICRFYDFLGCAEVEFTILFRN